MYAVQNVNDFFGILTNIVCDIQGYGFILISGFESRRAVYRVHRIVFNNFI